MTWATAGLMIVGLCQGSTKGEHHDGREARMTAADLVDKLLSDEHADVLCERVAWMARELMEADVSAQIGAELGERSLERTTQRNGYRSRDWDTRVGSIELAIPSCARLRVPVAAGRRAAAPSRPWSRWCRRPM